MERAIFLDDLPRRGKFIDWKNSIGQKVNFKYEDIEGTVEIIEYEKGKLKINYNNKTFPISISNFSNCTLGTVVGKYHFTYEHKYNVGDIIKNSNSGVLKIIKRTSTARGAKMKNARSYIYECLICGNRDTIFESSIVNFNSGCGVCASKKVKIGFNDIWTTNPDLGNLLWDFNDGYTYTCGSKKKVDWRCPNCNLKINNKEICSIKEQGLSCPKCSDGISFPNKLMYCVLTQLNIEFEREWNPSWAKVDGLENIKLNGRKYYDFYIPSINSVIEMHGSQHYRGSLGGFTRTLEEEIENDRLKEKLLHENGVKYICIDAKVSEIDYIKKNLLESNLKEIIDFSNVDWLKCEEECSNSLLIKACDLFKNQKISTVKIGLQLGVSKNCVIRYLKRGAKLGFCDYNAKEESKKSRIVGNSIAAEVSKRAVLQFSLDGTLVNEFDSAREAAKQLRLSFSVIPAACTGRQQSAGGYRWMYKDDYEQNKYSLKPYHIKKKVSPVVRMTLDGSYINEYGSIKEASNILNIGHSCISSVCKGKQKTAGGYMWAYKKDYLKDVR